MKRRRKKDHGKLTITSKNTAYELMVRDMTQTLLDAHHGLNTIAVQHDVRLKGTSGHRHQIDVYWEYQRAGITHRVIVNCKRYSRAVQITDVEAMKGVIADFPGTKGVIVTTKGYQAGALLYAKAHEIGLKVIRPASKEDYAGRAREIISDVRLVDSQIIKTEMLIDEPWFRKNISDTAILEKLPVPCDTLLTSINDLDKGERVTIADLFKRLDITREPDIEHTHSFQWENAMLEYPALPAIKLCVFNVTYKLHLLGGHVIHLGPTVGDMLVRDAIADTLLFIDKDGEITGDTEEESIVRGERPSGRGRSR
jgi:hypothetical protein